MTNPPNPGSRAAVDQGCLCPIWDNAHGRGMSYGLGGRTAWYTNTECPVHGEELRIMEARDG